MDTPLGEDTEEKSSGISSPSVVPHKKTANAEPAIPIVQIKSGIETYPEGDEIARQVVAGVTLEGQVADLAEISLEVEKKCADTAVDIERSPAVQAQWADTAADGLRSGTVPTQCADTVVKSKTAKKGNNRRKRKCSAKESDDSADEHPFILRKSTVAPVKYWSCPDTAKLLSSTG
ncbi:hypothetical protein PC128_g9839 [Phytophthora cactorum]|nr:hypothetical protein PC128_g9839 [Phytophthora cactorum]